MAVWLMSHETRLPHLSAALVPVGTAMKELNDAAIPDPFRVVGV